MKGPTLEGMRQRGSGDADNIIDFFSEVSAGILHFIFVLILVSAQARIQRVSGIFSCDFLSVMKTPERKICWTILCILYINA